MWPNPAFRTGQRLCKASGGKETIPFEQTSRYFRGRIVDALRELPPGAALSLAALGPRIKPDYTDADLPWLRKLAQGLARDGLARLDDENEAIALP